MAEIRRAGRGKRGTVNAPDKSASVQAAMILAVAILLLLAFGAAALIILEVLI